MRIKLHKLFVGKPPKPTFVNPYGANPHLKPYDKKDSPYATFGKPQGSPGQQKSAAEPVERRVSFVAEFVGYLFSDIAYVADTVSGHTKRMKELRAERARQKKENDEKYAAFVELASGGFRS